MRRGCLSCVARCWRGAVRYWEAMQVELHGKYSLERLCSFKKYSDSTSVAHALMIMAAAPLPCLLVAIVPNLIPLQPPEAGLGRSHMFWLRAFVSYWMMLYSLVEQCRPFVTQLPMTRIQVCAVSLVGTLGLIVFDVAIAFVIGFPVPFAMIIATPLSSLLMGVALTFLWRKAVREAPSSRDELKRYAVVLVVQICFYCVYPVYTYAFNQLSGLPQTAFALGLPVIKLAARNAVSYVLSDREDDKAEFVTFNVEVFHTLYVASCLQGSTSYSTTALIIVVDYAVACLALHDVYQTLNAVQSGVEKAAQSLCLHDKDTGTNSAARHDEPSSSINALNYLDAVVFLVNGSGKVAELSEREKRVLLAMSDPERLAFVQSVLKALHMTEFALLVEFTEVMVPIVYCIFMITTFSMSNREFYLPFHGMTTEVLHANIAAVFVYALLEVSSLVFVSVLLQRRLRISALRQLAFVLETSWKQAQAKLVFWVVLCLELLLQHYGMDFSFQFAWLHRSQPAS